MRTTHWPDVSEHQGGPITDALLRWALWSRWVAFRICDGTYIDHQAAANLSWTRRCRSLLGFIAYVVFPGSAARVGPSSVMAAFEAVVTGHHPRMVVMIDVEGWGGFVSGDHSDAIAQLRTGIAAHLYAQRPKWQRRSLARAWYRNADLRRVIIYGNQGDLHALAPNRHGASVVLADYDGPASVAGEVARQYTAKGKCPPWDGPVDLNVAPVGPRTLARKLGLGRLRWVL